MIIKKENEKLTYIADWSDQPGSQPPVQSQPLALNLRLVPMDIILQVRLILIK
jgi:hypothetical protein